MPRPRNNKIKVYDDNDPGILTFLRKDIEEEIPAKVGDTGMCYASSKHAGKKVIIIVLKD
jgi:hypothetical protein